MQLKTIRLNPITNLLSNNDFILTLSNTSSSTPPQTSNSIFNFQFLPLYDLSQLPKLNGSVNYLHWKTTAEYILLLFNCWNIILGRETQPLRVKDTTGRITNNKDIASYNRRYNYACNFLTATISPSISINQLPEKAPSAIWSMLYIRLNSSSSVSFYTELHYLLTLELKMTTTTAFITHLICFHTSWISLQQQCNSALLGYQFDNSYKISEHLHYFLNSSHVKAELLLDSLPLSLSLIIKDLPDYEILIFDMTPETLIQLFHLLDSKKLEISEGGG